MFGWLRDALSSAPSSLGYNNSIVSSELFHQQKRKKEQNKQIFDEHRSLSDEENDNENNDDEDEDENNLHSPSIDHSFYHNPYHSSGQMNYVDVPQQQYRNDHTYPTYLARQQTSTPTNSSLDDQIHSKLASLTQRSNIYQCYVHRQNNYAYRNRTLPIPSTTISSSTPLSTSYSNQYQINNNSHQSDQDCDQYNEQDIENHQFKNKYVYKSDNTDNNDNDQRSISINDYPRVPDYSSIQYSHDDDDDFDFASVVLWYRNVMQSVKKFL